MSHFDNNRFDSNRLDPGKVGELSCDRVVTGFLRHEKGGK